MTAFPYPHPAGSGVMVVGVDDVGLIAESHGFTYYLTPCCMASAKGSIADGEPATVCRACYAVVDDALGDVPAD